MRTAKEIINEFKAIADNPRKAMDSRTTTRGGRISGMGTAP